VGWYDVFMSRDTEALLDAFEHLPVEEKPPLRKRCCAVPCLLVPDPWKTRKSALPPPPCSNPLRKRRATPRHSEVLADRTY
jgi:hypothetical protein